MSFRRQNKKPHSLEEVINACEGIGDILVAETNRKSQERVLNTLKQLHPSISSRPFKDLDSDKGWELVYAYINQLCRLIENSELAKAEEVTKYSCFCLCWVLRDLCIQSGNANRIGSLIAILNRQIVEAHQKGHKLTYAALSEWPHTIWRNRDIVYSYWDRLFAGLLSLLWIIVSADDASQFKHLLSLIQQSFLNTEFPSSEVWDYGHILLAQNETFKLYSDLSREFAVDQKLSELSKLTYLWDAFELASWLDRFDATADLLDARTPEALRPRAQQSRSKVRDRAEHWHLRCRTVDMLFSLQASCLRHGKLEFVRTILELKQPPDSKVLWVGADLVPATPNELLSLYFSRKPLDRPFGWDIDFAIDTAADIERMFCILFAHLLRSTKVNSHYTIDVTKLAEPMIENLERHCKSIPHAARSLWNETDALDRLGLSALSSTPVPSYLEQMFIEAKTACRREIRQILLEANTEHAAVSAAPKFRPPIKVETATPEIVELQIQRRADSEANKKEVHGGI